MSWYGSRDTAQYYKARCNLCETTYTKRELNRIMLRDGFNGNPKQIAFVCEECLARVADFFECEIPELQTMHRKPYEYCNCPKCFENVGAKDRYCKSCGEKLRRGIKNG